MEGSSPLARGLLRGLLPPPPGRRIIPARAGFTRLRRVTVSASWDHPRSRGVYHVLAADLQFVPGSSPLARGLRPPGRRRRPPRRVIPARAGFTRHTARSILRREDHPRSRGVYLPASMRPPRSKGSSPLARGLLRTGDGDLQARRIIPARAGFTSCAGALTRSSADHPRSRGVYPPARQLADDGHGSSPLARGLLQETTIVGGLLGIIPARAGFT